MTQNVIAPRALLNFAERKWRELISRICSVSRVVVFSVVNTYSGLLTAGSPVDLISQELSSSFFKSDLDCIIISIDGAIHQPGAGESLILKGILQDQDGTVLRDELFLIDTPASPGGAPYFIYFNGQAKLYLDSDRNIRSNGIMLSSDTSGTYADPVVHSRVAAAALDFDVTKLKFIVRATAAGGNTSSVTIDNFQIEFLPGKGA